MHVGYTYIGCIDDVVVNVAVNTEVLFTLLVLWTSCAFVAYLVMPRGT